MKECHLYYLSSKSILPYLSLRQEVKQGDKWVRPGLIPHGFLLGGL